MRVTLTTTELNEFCAKVDVLESKGYDLSFTVDKTAKDQYNVEILGEHDVEELDRLTENGWVVNMESYNNYMVIVWYACIKRIY